MTELITFGETMAAFVPKESGYLRYAGDLSIRAAGSESNVAIGVSKLGHSSAWISRLGADELGYLIRNAIRSEGVDTSGVVWDQEYPTGVMIKQVRKGSETSVFYYRNDSAASHMETLDWDFLRQAKIIYISGITPVISDSCKKLVLDVANFAEEYKIWIAFDPNIRKKLWKGKDYIPLMETIAKRSQILMLGEEEAKQIYETDDMGRICQRAFASGNLRYLALKKGADGAEVSDGENVIKIQPYPCTCVDPVGAGDAFNAGFLSGILEENELELCGRIGAIAGAMATESRGDTEGIPDRDMLERILKQQDQIYR